MTSTLRTKCGPRPYCMGGGVSDKEDAVSALLSLAGWVNVVEEDVD